MDKIKEVITADQDGKQLISLAKKTAADLKRLKKTQIRKVFTEVRRIETMWEDDPQNALRRLNLLKPKLHYQAQRKREVKPLKRVLSDAIDLVVAGQNQQEQKQRFDRFADLFEAILAYHR